MLIKGDEEFIEITFDIVEDGFDDAPDGYKEITLDFSMKDVGWGVVGAVYFSDIAINNIYLMFKDILNGKIKEMHYSENSPHLIPKPFYWLDIIREDDEYLVHIKIHDCLEDYIELSEKVNKDRINEYIEEFEKVIEFIDRNSNE